MHLMPAGMPGHRLHVTTRDAQPTHDAHAIANFSAHPPDTPLPSASAVIIPLASTSSLVCVSTFGGEGVSEGVSEVVAALDEAEKKERASLVSRYGALAEEAGAVRAAVMWNSVGDSLNGHSGIFLIPDQHLVIFGRTEQRHMTTII